MKTTIIILLITGLVWIVVFWVYFKYPVKKKAWQPRTVEELETFTAQRRVEVKKSLEEHATLHPECQELNQQWMESEKQILCGSCKKPLFPNGIGDTLYLYYTCPHCGAFNGQDPMSGVSHFEVSRTYYWPIGYDIWNDLRVRYFTCIGWWK